MLYLASKNKYVSSIIYSSSDDKVRIVLVTNPKDEDGDSRISDETASVEAKALLQGCASSRLNSRTVLRTTFGRASFPNYYLVVVSIMD